ncbi:MAG: site-specific DNA-methyltransferase [Fermentimonas sp.]|nr:site-specific DNA-methyltransferase [Fermentimonas sp.]MDD4698039.1 site-specific DNA-methyltransferase [Fermentimonas sp.]
MKTVEIYNLGNLPTAPLDSFLELQEDFKITDSEKLAKLQMLILTRGFKYAFKAWQDHDGKLWIIDAHQRKKALIALRKAGFEIPEIPYEPIYAASKKEAVEEIAAYNSEFGKKNPDTLLFEKYEIESDTLDRFSLDFKPYAIESPDFGSDISDAEQAIVDEDSEEVISQLENLLEKEPVTKPGDLYLLGKHRLMCGDCLQSDDVNKLMNGRKADCSVTDPPYNVAYTGATEDELEIRNDEMTKDDFLMFIRQSFTSMINAMKPGAPIYVFHADGEGANFRIGFKDAGFKFAQCLIWVKNQFTMGRQDYQWQHEPILYGWKPGSAHTWLSDRKQATIWNFDKPQRNGAHPTMKPVALMAYPIRNSCPQRGIVIDFFLGSGSTIMAAQQTDRICYGMEIDPRYCDVIVERFKMMFPNEVIKYIPADVHN